MNAQGTKQISSRLDYVVKRDGSHEPVHFDKITSRISYLCSGLDTEAVNATFLAKMVIAGFTNGIKTTELDTLAAETAASLGAVHKDWLVLAARIFASNLHKNTEKTKKFSDVAKILYEYVDEKTQKSAPLLSEKVYSFIKEHAEQLDQTIVYKRDYDLDFFGLKTLHRSYLLKVNGAVLERPQHMWMRISCALCKGKVEDAIELYNLLSERYVCFGSPTLFNAGLPKAQLSSCFLQQMKEDSIDGIYDTLKNCALISKNSGGQSLAVHKIRSRGSYIRGTNGTSNGLLPMLRNFNQTAVYVDQGGGKRKGSNAIYLEPWHADIEDLLTMRKGTGSEEERCRDLYNALWLPDLFMQRVKAQGEWCLFCPDEAPGLADVCGEEFKKLYEYYESQPRLVRKRMLAQDLWDQILEALQEKGTPYMLAKDASNNKSNQRHRGVIQCSNLCAEIIQYTTPEEIAVCNLSSIALPRLVKSDGTFDFEKLHYITEVLTRCENNVIDEGWLPVPEAILSQQRNRAIGIGVQGETDVFMMMRYPFESKEAEILNRDIFETIYHGACFASCELAKRDGAYETFKGSPMSEGKFQFDLWNVKPTDRFDWEPLRSDIMQHGIRNSLLVAAMPTASTSQILGNTESFELPSYMIGSRKTLAGTFIVVCKYLLDDLIRLKLWSPEMKNRILANDGSIQTIMEIPKEIRDLYKTAFEVKQKAVVNLAVGRGPYICQSQSMNVHFKRVTRSNLSSMLMDGWERGLKTLSYYVRSWAPISASKPTVDPEIEEMEKAKAAELAEAEKVLHTKTSREEETTFEQPSSKRRRMEKPVEENACYIGCGPCGG